MLRLSIVASLAAAALAQTPPTWVSTNYYSGATCTGAPTSGRVDYPSVWALANSGQKTSCGADLFGGTYSMLTCTNGVAVVQKYTDNKCTVPKTPAEYWVPACTAVSGSSYGSYGSTCGTGAFPTSGSGIGLTTNTVVAGLSTSCSAAPGTFFYIAVSAFDSCLSFPVSSTTIAIKATCAGGVLTGSAYAGNTCSGTPITITSSCMSISGVPVTLSCTTPPAKSGAATVVAGVVATVAAAAAAVALA